MGQVRKGFCKDCRANVIHSRRFRSKVAWLLDQMTFQFAARFRLGAWSCMQCTKRSSYLHLPRKNVKTITIGDSDKRDDDSVVVENAGNYLKREKSIIARRERCSRYSAKYRESVVQKILDGHVTIAEVRREMDLTERDILDWILVAFEDQAQKIHELTDIIKALTASNEPLRISAEDSLPAGVVEPDS